MARLFVSVIRYTYVYKKNVCLYVNCIRVTFKRCFQVPMRYVSLTRQLSFTHYFLLIYNKRC